MKVSNYHIVMGTVDKLPHNLGAYLNDGWELYGHPYCDDTFHYQVVVKPIVTPPDFVMSAGGVVRRKS